MARARGSRERLADPPAARSFVLAAARSPRERASRASLSSFFASPDSLSACIRRHFNQGVARQATRRTTSEVGGLERGWGCRHNGPVFDLKALVRELADKLQAIFETDGAGFSIEVPLEGDRYQTVTLWLDGEDVELVS